MLKFPWSACSSSHKVVARLIHAHFSNHESGCNIEKSVNKSWWIDATMYCIGKCFRIFISRIDGVHSMPHKQVTREDQIWDITTSWKVSRSCTLMRSFNQSFEFFSWLPGGNVSKANKRGRVTAGSSKPTKISLPVGRLKAVGWSSQIKLTRMKQLSFWWGQPATMTSSRWNSLLDSSSSFTILTDFGQSRALSSQPAIRFCHVDSEAIIFQELTGGSVSRLYDHQSIEMVEPPSRSFSQSMSQVVGGLSRLWVWQGWRCVLIIVWLDLSWHRKIACTGSGIQCVDKPPGALHASARSTMGQFGIQDQVTFHLDS